MWGHLVSVGLAIGLGAAALLLSSTASTLALADEDLRSAKKLSASGQILPLEKIFQAAQSVKAGEVLEAELERKKGRYMYEIELLDNTGQVWEIKLDARTGTLIELESED